MTTPVAQLRRGTISILPKLLFVQLTHLYYTAISRNWFIATIEEQEFLIDLLWWIRTVNILRMRIKAQWWSATPTFLHHMMIRQARRMTTSQAELVKELFSACEAGDVGRVRRAVAAGVDPKKAINKDGIFSRETPLHTACMYVSIYRLCFNKTTPSQSLISGHTIYLKYMRAGGWLGLWDYD